jgi:hypothetical protein
MSSHQNLCFFLRKLAQKNKRKMKRKHNRTDDEIFKARRDKFHKSVKKIIYKIRDLEQIFSCKVTFKAVLSSNSKEQLEITFSDHKQSSKKFAYEDPETEPDSENESDIETKLETPKKVTTPPQDFEISQPELQSFNGIFLSSDHPKNLKNTTMPDSDQSLNWTDQPKTELFDGYLDKLTCFESID